MPVPFSSSLVPASNGAFIFYVEVDTCMLVLHAITTVYSFGYFWNLIFYPNKMIKAMIHSPCHLLYPRMAYPQHSPTHT